MTRLTTSVVAIAATAVTFLVVVLATRSRPATPHRAGPSSVPDVRVARIALGRILVNGQGHTLYLFLKDHHGKSSCAGACARVWPPAIVSHSARAGAGVKASKLTMTRRADHTLQLVYNSHPLYAMVADMRPGQTQGQGFLGTWFVVSPAGHRIGKPRRSAGGY